MNFLTLSFLEKYRDFGILLLRLGVGAVFVVHHGGPKLIAGPERWEAIGGAMGHVGLGFLPVVWGFLAAFAESVCALLIAIGLFTRPAALLLFITMAIAALHHFVGIGDGMAGANHALKMAAVFLGLIFIGAGRFSFDTKLK